MCTEFYVTSICAFVILHKATGETDYTDWHPRPRQRQVHISDIFQFCMCTETNTMWEDTREVSQWSPFHHHIHVSLICMFFKYEKKGEYLGKTLLENMYNTVMVDCRGVPFVSISWFEKKKNGDILIQNIVSGSNVESVKESFFLRERSLLWEFLQWTMWSALKSNAEHHVFSCRAYIKGRNAQLRLLVINHRDVIFRNTHETK